jgi:hypothetical protein
MKTTQLEVILLLAALGASPAIFADEYGLIVDPSYPPPCKRELRYTLNYCTTDAVVEDLRRHFISGLSFRIKAVEMAVLSGSMSLPSHSVAQAPFNEVISDICTTESPHDFDTLLKFLRYLPYRSLRARLTSELRVAEPPAVRARLQQALSALPAAKPATAGEVAEAAIFTYKRELSEAGDRDKCKEAMERLRRAMTFDARLADADIQAEIDLYEKHKGPMPYPSPGTACSLFGFQEVAHAALAERRNRTTRPR